jgi:hypothetical protein
MMAFLPTLAAIIAIIYYIISAILWAWQFCSRTYENLLQSGDYSGSELLNSFAMFSFNGGMGLLIAYLASTVLKPILAPIFKFLASQVGLSVSDQVIDGAVDAAANAAQNIGSGKGAGVGKAAIQAGTEIAQELFNDAMTGQKTTADEILKIVLKAFSDPTLGQPTQIVATYAGGATHTLTAAQSVIAPAPTTKSDSAAASSGTAAPAPKTVATQGISLQVRGTS